MTGVTVRTICLLVPWLVSSLSAAATVSGRVRGLEGNDHVLIKLRGEEDHRTTTRSGGRWLIDGVTTGTYTVTPIHARYTFTPVIRTITVDEGTAPEIDFQATPTRGRPEQTEGPLGIEPVAVPVADSVSAPVPVAGRSATAPAADRRR
jgi:hypothetical protein